VYDPEEGYAVSNLEYHDNYSSHNHCNRANGRLFFSGCLINGDIDIVGSLPCTFKDVTHHGDLKQHLGDYYIFCLSRIWRRDSLKPYNADTIVTLEVEILAQELLHLLRKEYSVNCGYIIEPIKYIDKSQREPLTEKNFIPHFCTKSKSYSCVPELRVIFFPAPESQVIYQKLIQETPTLAFEVSSASIKSIEYKLP
jgi:hypothetical protein